MIKSCINEHCSFYDEKNLKCNVNITEKCNCNECKEDKLLLVNESNNIYRCKNCNHFIILDPNTPKPNAKFLHFNRIYNKCIFPYLSEICLAPKIPEILLSIHTKFVKKIETGIKKYEFRRKIWSNWVNKEYKIYIYSSGIDRKITGYFFTSTIINLNLFDLWGLTEKEAGISKDYFIQYFNGQEKGFAIKIRDFVRLDNPIDVKGIVIPQNFRYFNFKEEIINKKLKQDDIKNENE